jgi:hypothetical protein
MSHALPSDRVGKSSVAQRLSRPLAAVPLAVATVFAIIVPAAWHRFASFDGNSCPATLVPDGLWPTGAFAGVVGGFLLGGLLGKLAHQRADEQAPGALLTAQIGLTFFTAGLTLTWWYETRAFASSGDIHAITDYVMCIKSTQNDWTLIVFTISALVLGRWLWHRPGTYF